MRINCHRMTVEVPMWLCIFDRMNVGLIIKSGLTKSSWSLRMLLAALIFSVSGSAIAADFEGYIIELTGDSIACTFSFSRDISEQVYKGELLSKKKISAIVDGKKVSYSAKKVKGYGIRLDEGWKWYESGDAKRFGYRFVKREATGTIDLFTFWTYDELKFSYLLHYILLDTRTGKSTYFPETCVGCRQKMIEYVSDCPLMAGNIMSTGYSAGNRDNWVPMIKEYNKVCGNF